MNEFITDVFKSILLVILIITLVLWVFTEKSLYESLLWQWEFYKTHFRII